MDALSSQEGRRVLLLFTDGQNTPDTGQSVTFETVRRRVDAMGTTEPTIVRQGSSRTNEAWVPCHSALAGAGGVTSVAAAKRISVAAAAPPHSIESVQLRASQTPLSS